MVPYEWDDTYLHKAILLGNGISISSLLIQWVSRLDTVSADDNKSPKFCMSRLDGTGSLGHQ